VTVKSLKCGKSFPVNTYCSVTNMFSMIDSGTAQCHCFILSDRTIIGAANEQKKGNSAGQNGLAIYGGTRLIVYT